MSTESPAVVSGTSFVTTVNVGQKQLGAKWQFVPEELNPIAMDLMRRIWEYGGDVISVRRLAEDGSWEIRFCSDRKKTNVSAVTLSVIPYKSVCVLVRGERYDVRSEEELRTVIPYDRAPFIKRFQIAEKDFARKLPRTIARNCGRSV